VFPRSGLKVSAERLRELSTERNLRNKPLIQEVPEEIKKPAKKVRSNVE